MARAKTFTWGAVGVGMLIIAVGLAMWIGPNRQTSSAQDGPKSTTPLISRGYTDTPAGTAVIAGDPLGGAVLLELRITDGQKVKRDDIIAVLSNYPKADVAVRSADAELIKAQQRAGLLPEQFEVLESYVPGSRLHAIINNPHDEGIDEG